jgi:hypothetical protein
LANALDDSFFVNGGFGFHDFPFDLEDFGDGVFDGSLGEIDGYHLWRDQRLGNTSTK